MFIEIDVKDRAIMGEGHWWAIDAAYDQAPYIHVDANGPLSSRKTIPIRTTSSLQQGIGVA